MFDRLLEERDSAGAKRDLPAVLRARDDVHRDVPCIGMVLQVVEHRPAVHHGQLEVEHDRIGLELVRECEPRVASLRDDGLEATRAGDLENRACEIGVVLDDEHDPVTGLDHGAIVLDVSGQKQRRIEIELDGRAVRARRRRVVDVEFVCRRPRWCLRVRRGQVERERAALAAGRLDMDLAAEEPRNLAADRQAEPCAAVAAVRLAVRLLERLEDQLQLVLRDSDPRVEDREGEH